MRFVALALVILAAAQSRPVVETIAPNDNRQPAGQLTGSVLRVQLEARTGEWRPDGVDGPTITTAAFAETGKGLQTPGPLLRAPVGTEVRATVKNSLAKPMWLFGMSANRGISDSVLVAPGTSRELAFRLTEPGSYFYMARTDTFPVTFRVGEDSQLGGIIVADAPGERPRADERLFAITTWFEITPKTQSGVTPSGTFAFNGRSWPATERFEMTQGDSAHWRFINLSLVDHPLHLHGFYFRVNAKGDAIRDTIYAPASRRMAVTEYLAPLQTTALSWSPDRSGGWVFHCHFAGHFSARGAWDTDKSLMTPSPVAHSAHEGANHAMAGLVFAVKVKPRAGVTLAGSAGRPLRLIIRSRAKVYGEYVGYSYALGGSPEENDGSMKAPGPVLELTRGERVAITIVNRTHEGAAVHWHGIELESYADGVPGISGEGNSLLPVIPPGDSLTVRFTPPRAGTFMYHSHSNEFQQISSGLYGAIIVREPGARPDPNERLWIFSDGGPTINFFDPSRFSPLWLNGRLKPDPIDLPSGVPVKIRLVSIRADVAVDVAVMNGDKPAQWRILAKDGMTVPAHQSGVRPAAMVVGAGEIYDLELTAPPGAELTLRYTMPGVPPQAFPPVLVPIRAR